MNNRELDKWIDENIFGKRIGRPFYIVPRYTESISDAFQVVEKMMEKFPDWFCTIDIFSQNYNKEDKGKGHCVVTFQESAEGYTIYSCEQAETIPLAICLAAKKAFKEVE